MIVSNKAVRVSGGVVQTLYPDRESWNANFTAWMLQMEHFGRLAPCLIAASEDRLEIGLFAVEGVAVGWPVVRSGLACRCGGRGRGLSA